MSTHKALKAAILLGYAALLLAAVSAALAQGAAGLTLDWWTADGGGGQSSGGRYSLQATIGQPEAGVMSGGGYTLLSGYWDVPGDHQIFLPAVWRP